jgi:aminoglycoside 3-N-acetyltransferase
MNGNFHYQHASTPSCVGAISEAFRTQPDAVCSFHPSHRAAAIGPLAHDLTRDHLASSPLGPGSPFHRITEHDAHVMLLGCDHISNSMLHVAEAMAPRCYLNVGPMLPDSSEPIEATEIATLEYANRKTVEIKFYDVPRCSRGFGAAEPVLRDRDLITDARLGDAPVQLMPASDTLAAILDTLTTTPDLLLCHSPDCLVCPPRRTWLRK